MKLGIVGLPNVGKSTLFNALTNGGAASANYAFCTIEPNVGVVSVPDERLDRLAEIYHPEKYTPAVVEFVDIAGLVKGASQGEGLGNKFLANIREVDAIVHVVRCFSDSNIIRVDDSINSVGDVETIALELMLADMEQVEKRIERLKKLERTDKEAGKEKAVLEKVLVALNEGRSPRTLDLTEEELALLEESRLLSMKPVIYAANIGENEVDGSYRDNQEYAALAALAEQEHSGIVAVCAQIEAELSDMSPEDKEAFLDDLGIQEAGLAQLIRESYSLLGLISFLTAGPKEVRAWTILRGTKAPGAAGKIHSDFERGFIRAEVVAYDDFIREGNMNAVREKGLLRSEGKEYVVQDGDIVLFRFNV